MREQAREAAASVRGQEAARWARAAMAASDLTFLSELEQRLGALNEAWPVHEKPLLTRWPFIGRVLSWLGSRLARFLLQHQASFNAETARLLQQLYQAQRLLTEDQIERTDDLFSRLDERLLALEMRLKDLEEDRRLLRRP